MNTIETRLTELEIKASYADDMVETLNHALYRQQQQIDLLQRQIVDLQRQVQVLGVSQPGAGTRLRDEIPPHY